MKRLIDEIKDTLEKHTEIKAVSFDIFDTLLFRISVIPDRVFWYMYRKYRNAFPSFTTVGDWVSSRKIAEQEARRISKEIDGHEEISLADIYRHLPTAYSNPQKLMQLEIDSECELGFLNTEILEILQYIRTNCQKKIFLISDMYLNSQQIEKILTSNGFDLSLIQMLYVSSETKCNKNTSKLFQFVLNAELLKPYELLHIGDNLQSDILSAKQLQIHTFYYNFISEHRIKYPFFLCEQEFFDGPLCDKIYLTRLFAGQHNQGITEKENFLFTLGSMIIGPFLTYAVEWIIDVALEENILNIRPFMREGHFITQMLIAAKENRGIDLSIKPLYISRLAAYSSRFSEITAKDISILISSSKTTPQDTFRLLQIEDLLCNFAQYSRIPFTKLKTVSAPDGNTIFNIIFNYLSSPETLEIIHERNQNKKTIFADYLEQMNLLEPAITVDIGWNGTTMNAVYQTVHERNPNHQLLQLLLCSTKNVAKSAVDGCIIKGFIGNYGGLQGKFNRIFFPIFELFCLCNEGPTIGYKYHGQKVVPIIDKNVFSSDWISNIKIIQHGVLSFQKEFFSMCKKKPEVTKDNLKAQGVQALCMIERLFSCPLYQEVKQLKSAELDQNVGIEERIIPILENDLCSQYQQLGLEQFYRFFRNLQQSITWHQALPTLNDPLIYLKMVYLQKSKYGKLSTILLIEYALKLAKRESIAIVIDRPTPADNLAIIYFKLIGAYEKIAGVTSVNKYMCGIKYNGFLVSSIDTDLHTKLYFIPIKEKLSYNLLREKVIKSQGNNTKIIGYYENDLEVRYHE